MTPFTLLSAKLACIEGAGGAATGLLGAKRPGEEDAGGIATGAFCAMTGADCTATRVPLLPDEIACPKNPSVTSRQMPGMSNRPSPGPPPPPKLLGGISIGPGC